MMYIKLRSLKDRAGNSRVPLAAVKGLIPPETTKLPKAGKSSQAGFTLVEVMVALIILVVTATGILASFVTTKRYISRAKRRIIAVNFARQGLEELLGYVRQDTWTDSNPGVNPLYAPEGTPQVYNNGLLPSDFGLIWNGSSSYTVTNNSNTAYRTVKMDIVWNEPNAP